MGRFHDVEIPRLCFYDCAMDKAVMDRIALKLVMFLVFFSLILTLTGTLVQLRSDYLREVETIRVSMNNVVSGHRQEISRFLESGEINTIKKILYHLSTDTVIAYASISAENRVEWEQGGKNGGKNITLTYPLRSGSQPDTQLGVLLVSAEIEPVQNKLREKFVKILTQNAIYICLMASFVFVMFQLMVTRHLEKLAKQVAELDPAKPYSPLRLAGNTSASNDELAQVVIGVNTMLKKARETYETLEKNEERLLLFFDSTEEAIVGVDRSGLCTFANNACRKLLEINDDEEIIGKKLSLLFQHSSREYSEAENALVALSMAKAQALHCNDGNIVIPSGKEIYVSLRSYPVYDEEGRFFSTISVSREVTYEIKLQDELINAKKMEAVGRLSANLAHEFGNPLFGISAVLKDVKERENLDESDVELLNLAHSECKRLRTMVREFQNLYKVSSNTLEYQSIADVINTVLSEAEPVMRTNNILYEVELIDAAEQMIVSGSKLAMVLNNVVLNGIESMIDTGGHLRITTTVDEEFFIITVSDEGIGVKKEYQELIFEPFFSTKSVVQGAGLGLSIAYGTMKSLGGTISFASREGKGTSFHIHMPQR